MASKSKNQITNKDLFLIIVIIPILFVIMVASYLLLKKLAWNNQRICSFYGGIWERKPTIDNPTPMHRCYTYEELYSSE